jgi:hypothetical protein
MLMGWISIESSEVDLAMNGGVFRWRVGYGDWMEKVWSGV